MPERAPTTELLLALAGVMRAAGARWYVFGAQAVLLWGRPRLSADVDATVELELADVESFLTKMQRAGFGLRISDDVEGFVARTRVLPFLHQPTGVPLDLVLAGTGLESSFMDRAVMVVREGVELPVISPEDLVVTKILAGRPRDLEDVRGVLAERARTLDIERARGDLTALEEALGRSDLVPLLDRLRAESELS